MSHHTSARTPHLSAKDEGDKAGRQLFENLFLGYEELMVALKLTRRTCERLVSKGIIPKIPNVYPARFYWPDVVEGLRNQKGARKK